MMVYRRHPPHLVGASGVQIALPREHTTTRVSFDNAAHGVALARLKPDEAVEAFLNIENVTGSGIYGSFEVFVGVPGHPPADALLAGQLSTFGVHIASQPDGAHGGGGITTVLDISKLMPKLRQLGWDGTHLDVTLSPKHVGSAPPKEVPSDLKIGRLSIYYT